MKQLKPRYRTQSTWTAPDVELQVNKLTGEKIPSLTKPNQSKSLGELIQRFNQGLLTDVSMSAFGKGRYYLGEDSEHFDSPDIEKLRDADLVDQNLYMETQAKRTKAYGVAKEAQAKEAAEQAAKEELLASQKVSTTAKDEVQSQTAK